MAPSRRSNATSADAVAMPMPKPMLAKEYDPAKARFPCLLQPKLDGVRLLVRRGGDGGLELRSRTGKPMDHLAPMLAADLPASRLPAGVVLDGELYIHGVGFQSVVSVVRNTRMSDESRAALQYHVYDLIPAPGGAEGGAGYTRRLELLRGLLRGVAASGRVRLVRTELAEGADHVQRAIRTYMREGYEGVIVRDPDSPYEPGRRSPGLSKYKLFHDDEFRIVGVSEAGGKDAGTAILRCAAANGREFNVRPRGTMEYRAQLLRDEASLIGKKLTVRFQELTDDGVPRFPVGVAVRDYE